MDKELSLLDQVLKWFEIIKTDVINFVRHLPILDRFSDNTIEWLLICSIFVITISIIIPILKWSVKVSILATIFAAIAAFFTTASFWSLLPFTGLGVMLLSYANKGGRETA